jgi:hypothetical protein
MNIFLNLRSNTFETQYLVIFLIIKPMHKGKERKDEKHPTQLHELPNFLEMKHNSCNANVL